MQRHTYVGPLSMATLICSNVGREKGRNYLYSDSESINSKHDSGCWLFEYYGEEVMKVKDISRIRINTQL